MYVDKYVFQVAVVACAFGSIAYVYWYTDHFHFNLMKVYAHVGHPQAQHDTGHKYLKGTATKDTIMNLIGKPMH